VFLWKGQQTEPPVIHPGSKAGNQYVEVHNDCDGSAECRVELRIHQRDRYDNKERYIELHLSEEEAKALRKAIKDGYKRGE
jgi:hypothetical protein